MTLNHNSFTITKAKKKQDEQDNENNEEDIEVDKNDIYYNHFTIYTDLLDFSEEYYYKQKKIDKAFFCLMTHSEMLSLNKSENCIKYLFDCCENDLYLKEIFNECIPLYMDCMECRFSEFNPNDVIYLLELLKYIDKPKVHKL